LFYPNKDKKVDSQEDFEELSKYVTLEDNKLIINAPKAEPGQYLVYKKIWYDSENRPFTEYLKIEVVQEEKDGILCNGIIHLSKMNFGQENYDLNNVNYSMGGKTLICDDRIFNYAEYEGILREVPEEETKQYRKYPEINLTYLEVSIPEDKLITETGKFKTFKTITTKGSTYNRWYDPTIPEFLSIYRYDSTNPMDGGPIGKFIRGEIKPCMVKAEHYGKGRKKYATTLELVEIKL
jgi:hypothetical protein